MTTSFGRISGSREEAAPVSLFTFTGAMESEHVMERLIQSVCLIPGTTEFGYGTTPVVKEDGSGKENAYAGGTKTDFVRAMEQLLERAPNLTHVSLVLAWHGTDLRVGECQIKPRVDAQVKPTTPYEWRVGPVTRDIAEEVSYVDGNPAAGGAPSDRTVFECITWMRERNIAVTVYPFILMDVELGNDFPNPWGGDTQPPYPWRGRISCHPAPGMPGTVDQTAEADAQVDRFFGTAQPSDFGWDAENMHVTYTGPDEWSFRRHILHLAQIAQVAGATDFLIGSEMVELNRIRSDRTTYPAVDRFVTLLHDCRSMLGPNVEISYASDWSEWSGHRPADGSGDVLFHLDKLYADDDLDYIGIDNYMPLADWRSGTEHLDYKEGFMSTYDLDYLRGNVQAGEGFDWYYASYEDRMAQVRTPITDGAYGKPWVYRYKDLPNFWSNVHINRVGGVETTQTPWVPESKRITFTELGCSCANRGANQPNVFVDPKSSENNFPYNSLGIRDDLIQRAFNEAALSFWEEHGGAMLRMDRISIWAWDARPYPDFPDASHVWTDSENWEYGHWLNGRLQIPTFEAGSAITLRYTNHSRPVVHGGFTYEPIPIKTGRMKTEGSLERTGFQIEVPRNSDIAQLFRDFRSTQPIMLSILQGHLSDVRNMFVPRWHGRVTATKRSGEQLNILGIPTAAALARTGLTRNYQYGCPHVLYGPLCRANKERATNTTSVVDVDGRNFEMAGGWNGEFDGQKYVGGVVEWTRQEGQIERRRILTVAGNVLSTTGPGTGLQSGDVAKVILGCDHTVNDCANLHNNINNCGACPLIPKTNPLGSDTNNFY